MDAMIEVQNVNKSFGEEHVLKDVSHNFETGKIHGIVGNNGSGKTVLMKCICGFLKPDSGTIFVNHKQVGRDTDFPEDIGIIIETPGFLPHLSGTQNLKILASLNNHTIRAVLEQVGLDPDMKKPVGKYSLGMRQRLGFAQALMEDPSLLILDSKSYKNKKRIDNDRENWLVFKDVHEPIIERVIWEQIQEKRGKIRKRKPKDGERNIFSGLLVCADCGHNLNYHFNQGNHDIKYFNCSNYRGNRGTCSSTHYIRVDFLEQVVLGEIKRLTKYAVHYEDQFLEAVMGSSQKSAEAEHKRKQKELAAAQVRDQELDGLFERIYEDNLAGKLSDDRFAKMSQLYEAEQAELAEKMKLLHREIDKLSSNSVSTDLFLSTVRKYTRAKKLTPRMLNELINRIEVHQAEKINGEWVQRLTIHYNCIGALFIPDTEPLPAPNVTVNTRRGVYVTYEPAQNE